MIDKNLIEQLATAYRRYIPESAWVRETRLLDVSFRAGIATRGYLSRANDQGEDEFMMIVEWKAARQKGHADVNSSDLVATVSREAFNLASSGQHGLAVQVLDYLSGVNARMATAILMVYEPKQCTVMDVLAWDALGYLRACPVTAPADLEPTTYLDKASTYEPYLAVCRKLADDHGVGLRMLDRCLWMMGKFKLDSESEIRRWLTKTG